MTDSREIHEELGERLYERLEVPVEVEHVALIPGGTSKEAWTADVGTPEGKLELIVLRKTGGAIYSGALSLEQECRVQQAAYESGIRVPEPYGYFEDFAGREAFVMERLEGEDNGSRVVQDAQFAATREALPRRLAEELARIHAIPLERLPSLPGARTEPAAPHAVESLEKELDLLDESHPAVEYGLSWLREHPPRSHGIVLNHGDFRVGNLLLDEEGLVGVLDWDLAHLGDPAEDLAWALVRAWRFGVDHLRLGGIGEVEPYLERYNALTGRGISPEDLFYWEVLGNVKWVIGALNHARRHLSDQERNVGLATAGRLAAQAEYEVLHLIERGA